MFEWLSARRRNARKRQTSLKPSGRKLRTARKLQTESLEDRRVLTAVTMTEHEQLLLELVNRARMDPLGEVARNPNVASLNEDLAAGTISSTPKQPLAPVQPLVNAAGAHAQDMLDNDYFSHTGLDGSTPTSRAAEFGYTNSVGENIGWSGTTGTLNQTATVFAVHDNLFDSPGHRQNLMYDIYEEAGTGVRFGQYTSGHTYNAGMLAESFSFANGNNYFTGVAYDDSVLDDDFYSIGESVANVRVSALNLATGISYATATGASGGYALAVPAGTYTVTLSGEGVMMVAADVAMGTANVKVDFDTSTMTAATDDLAGNVNGAFWVGESDGNQILTSRFGSWSGGLTWRDVSAADFNGDGLDDIAGRAPDGSLWVQLATGNDNFLLRHWGNWAGIAWENVSIGDFNGDDRADLVGRAPDGTFWVARSTGSSFVTEYWGAWSTATQWTNVTVGDFDGNQTDDLAGRAADGTWWVQRSNGSRFQSSYWGRWSPNVEWTDVVVGDFNGDGADDLAGRTNGQWWVNRSLGSRFNVEFWGRWATSVNWTNVLAGDFDGDGNTDIAGRANGAWWIARSSGSLFSNVYGSVVWSNSLNWEDVMLADINGDGRDDIVGRVNGQWWSALSQGSRFASQHLGNWSSTADWQFVSVGNFAV